MKKNDLQSTLNRFVSFFRSSKTDKNDDNLSTKTGGARMQRRADVTDTSQFDDYLQRAPTKQVGRMKSKKGETARTATNNSVKMELIQKCYRTIPERYFKQGSSQQLTELAVFRGKRRELEDAQQRIAGHLDEIQLCLFNQVTSRFDEFVSVLMAIESLDVLVKDNLNRLATIRQSNAMHRQRFALKADRVCDLQLKVSNMRKLSDLMGKLKRVQTANEFIRANILRSKDSCTSLIEQMQEDKPTMMQLSCISEDYDSHIQECVFLIKKDFTESFTEEMFNYISGAGDYKSEFWTKLGGYPDLVEGEGCEATNTTMVLDEEVIYDDKNTYDSTVEGSIIETVLNGWRNGQLAVDSTKGRLAMFLNKLYGAFAEDMHKFCREVLKQREVKFKPDEGLSELLSKMSLQFFVKVVEYYSSLHMKYLKRMFSVGRPMINQLLALTSTIEEPVRPQLHNLIEGIFNIQLATVKLVLDKVVQLLNLRKLSCSLDFYRFRNYVRLFEIWQQFFSGEASELVKYTIPAECTYRDRVYVLKSKLNGHFISTSKSELLLNFVTALHKNIMTVELKKEMDDDTWQAEDIPTSFYETLSYLIAGDSWNNRRNVQTTVLESSIFFDRSFNRKTEKSNLRPDETMEIERRVNLKIIKNECVVEGKTYKISKAFLYLLELLEQYVRLAETFPTVQEQVGLKLCEVVHYYNKYTYQLIIGAKAVALGRIKNKNITARHLCVCSLCIDMLGMLLRKISERIKISQLPKAIEDLTSHHTEIVRKLKSILMARVTSSLEEIDLLKVPCKGTENIVTSAKTLFDIVQDYLTPENTRRIFDGDLFRAYNERIGKLPIRQLAHAEVLKEDMNFYFSELRVLETVVPDYWQLRQAGDAIIVRAFESF